MRKIIIDPEAEANIEWEEYTPRKKEKSVRRRLLVTTDNFLPRWDGISRFLSEVLPRLKDKYDITVLAPDYGEIKLPGIKIVQLPTVGKYYGDYTPSRLAYKEIKQLIRESDVVFNQALGPVGLCSILAARTAKRPLASYIHSVEWELFPKALAAPVLRGPLVFLTKIAAKFFYNRCTLLITPSENIAEQFSWRRIKTPKKIARLGVDTKKFRPGQNTHAKRQELGLPTDAFIVGYHGRIAHEKNLMTLMRGFNRLKIKKKHLLIVGSGVPSIRNKLAQFKNVTVTGSKDNPQEYLQCMDVYVQPSFTETTSLTVLEAMASGLPVVSSKVGFIKYYLIDRENGMFFDNTSAFHLSRQLQELYTDQALRRKLGDNARKTIEKSFSWDQTATAVEEALDDI